MLISTGFGAWFFLAIPNLSENGTVASWALPATTRWSPSTTPDQLRVA
ncbi:hypothetical protein [Actinophytocola sp. NPDC049390]